MKKLNKLKNRANSQIKRKKEQEKCKKMMITTRVIQLEKIIVESIEKSKECIATSVVIHSLQIYIYV